MMMSMKTKQEVLKTHLNEWLACKGNKKKRGELIAKLSSILDMHPKSIGRSMKRIQLRSVYNQPKKRGRKLHYGADVDAALYQVWREMEYPCGENMYPMIAEYVEWFKKEGSWNFYDETTKKLLKMSLGTLKKRISRLRKKYKIGKGRSSTLSSPLKDMIPIRKSDSWQNLPPGYTQVDSVAHCGDKLTTDVVYNVGIVDFATYWSEYKTQWNKGQIATQKSLDICRSRFPFPLIELHPDTGTEFINYHIKDWTDKNGIAMTRSEPYEKNDNMCIEERNGFIARKHLGYVRLDDESLVELTSEIMRIACLLHNHFKAVRRLVKKEKINGKWKKELESVAKTPYQRVMESDHIAQEYKDKLKQEHEKLNPLQLKRELDKLKKELGRRLEVLRKNRDRIR